jgi:hypothetical protein
LEAISKNDILADLASTSPKTVQEGGRMAPYIDADYKSARNISDAAVKDDIEVHRAGPFYFCGGVLHWATLTATTTPGVQINIGDIDRILDNSFKDGPPSAIMQPVGVAITQNGFEAMEHKGGMKIVTPIEFVHAALKACYLDICRDAGDAILRKWKDVFTTMQIDFYRIPENLCSYLSFHLREQMLEAGETVAWTMLQKVQMVIREKHCLEMKGGKVSAARVSAMFVKQVKMAKSSEVVSPSFVDCALTIENRILC